MAIGGVVRMIQPVSDVCYVPSDCPPVEKPHNDDDEDDSEQKR
jgi:hypothetical protein